MAGHRENPEERLLSAAFSEERLDDGGAVSGQNAGGDFYPVVEAGVGEDFEAGTDGTAFGIVGAEDKARDAGLDEGARAHAAGLNGDVQRSIRKAVVAKPAGRFSQTDDFGVGGGVAIANGAIARTGKDLAVVDEQGADGDFAGLVSGTRFSECFLHELDVNIHRRRENNMRKRVETKLTNCWVEGGTRHEENRRGQRTEALTRRSSGIEKKEIKAVA